MTAMRFLLCGLLAGLIGLTCPAQNPSGGIESAGDKIPGSFRSFIVRDERFPIADEKNRTGKLHCLVCENGLSPVVAVFSRHIPKDANDPLVAILKLQDELAKKYFQQKLGAFAVFLSLTQVYEDDPTREAKTADVANFGRQVNVKNVPLGLAEATILVGEKPTAPKQVQDYGIGDADDVTVLFYDRLKVVQRWKYTADKGPTEEDAKAIAAKVAEHLKK